MLALANEVNIDLTYDDFERIRKKTPHLADMKPGGNYVMESLDRIGGIPFVLKKLLEKGLLNENCITVTGKTIKENLNSITLPNAEQNIVRSIENPIHEVGTAVVLKGTLAPEGAVIKTAGVEMTKFTGNAKVYDWSFCYKFWRNIFRRSSHKQNGYRSSKNFKRRHRNVISRWRFI